MIRDYLGKKVANRINGTRFGHTKFGQMSVAILDDERFEVIGQKHLDSLTGHHNHSRMFALTIAVNAISWLSVFLIPSVVSKLFLAFSFVFSKGGLVLAMPAGGFTIAGVYTLLRIWYPAREYGPDDGVVMQSYGRDTQSLLTWKLWLVSCGLGGINVILLWAAYLVMTGEYEYYERVGEFPWDLYF